MALVYHPHNDLRTVNSLILYATLIYWNGLYVLEASQNIRQSRLSTLLVATAFLQEEGRMRCVRFWGARGN